MKRTYMRYLYDQTAKVPRTSAYRKRIQSKQQPEQAAAVLTPVTSTHSATNDRVSYNNINLKVICILFHIMC